MDAPPLSITKWPDKTRVVVGRREHVFWISEHQDLQTGEKFRVVADAGGKVTTLERI